MQTCSTCYVHGTIVYELQWRRGVECLLFLWLQFTTRPFITGDRIQLKSLSGSVIVAGRRNLTAMRGSLCACTRPINPACKILLGLPVLPAKTSPRSTGPVIPQTLPPAFPSAFSPHPQVPISLPARLVERIMPMRINTALLLCVCFIKTFSLFLQAC